MPVCNACGDALSGAYTDIDGILLHDECFKCCKCNTLIGDDEYFDEEDAQGEPTGRFLCSNCEDDSNGEPCYRCGKLLNSFMIPDEYPERKYCDECFSCELCQKSLADGCRMAFIDDKMVCVECAARKDGRMCTKCEEPIVNVDEHGMTRWVTDATGRRFHYECFALSLIHI
eukprot:TRINITY_DN37211_c0_g1_i2.p1 TRINITY_DN37211_c0_g1~~TRINITY_DN37211_c0_g1_i2.p1  ORF type:complete len:172 (-),score=32.31 TRINITY_DN37211_c0_g1_i2:112-627(-)